MVLNTYRIFSTKERINWELVAISGMTLVLICLFLTLDTGAIIVSCIYLFDFLLLINIALRDVKKRMIPNRVVIRATFALVAFAPWTPHLQGEGYLHALSMSSLGWVFGIVWMGLAASLASGRLGGGDVKFAGLVGAMTGIPFAPAAIGVGVVFSGVYALVLAGSGTKIGIKEIPYAPGLSLGCGVVMMCMWIVHMSG